MSITKESHQKDESKKYSIFEIVIKYLKKKAVLNTVITFFITLSIFIIYNSRSKINDIQKNLNIEKMDRLADLKKKADVSTYTKIIYINKIIIQYEDLIKKRILFWSWIEEIAKLFLGAGFFTVIAKTITLLPIFKKVFKELLIDEHFIDFFNVQTNIVAEKISIDTESLVANAFSSELYKNDIISNLSRQNLNDLWKKITLIKLAKNFNREDFIKLIEKNLENVYFNKLINSYYYKDFRISYDIIREPGDNYITITETTNFILVRPTRDEFTIDFHYRHEVDDSIKTSIFLCEKKTKSKVDVNDSKGEAVNGEISHILKTKLSGYYEYRIKRILKTKQNIEMDKSWVFSTKRIIDGFTIDEIQYNKHISVLREISNKHKIEELNNPENIRILNQEENIIILPNELFRLIIIKK